MWNTAFALTFLFVVSHLREAGSSDKVKVVSTVDVSPVVSQPPKLTTRPHRKREASFFDFGSGVYLDDFPRGNVHDLLLEAGQHDNAFFMYYASWDGDSISARSVFSKVAETYHVAQEGLPVKEVYIAAVNCWHPSSDCVKDFKGQQFPAFVFYPKDRKGILYGGPITVPDILDFLREVTSPLRHLASHQEWLALRAEYGGCSLVGFFPDLFQNPRSRKQYKTFIRASYLMLQTDPHRSIGFGVVTDPKLAFQLHLNATSVPARITFWNGTSVAFPRKSLHKKDLFYKWIKGKMAAVSLLSDWAGSSGRKSVLLRKRLKANNGMSLLVFMQKRHGANEPLLNLVRETSLRYRTCIDSSLLTPAQRSLSSSWTRRDSASDEWFVEFVSLGKRDSCSRYGPSYNHTLHRPTFESFTVVDGTAALRQQQARQRLDCLYDYERKRRSCDADADASFEFLTPSESIRGLGCVDNRTLNFYTVDVATQSHLARSIGVTLNADRPTAVIVSLRDEAVYGSENLTLSAFVDAFHQNQESLPKVKLSKEVGRGKCDIRSGSTSSSSSTSTSCLEEINGLNFEQVTMDPERNVVLLYRTDSCAFCTAASPAAQVFHSVLRVFERRGALVDLGLRFATVDAAFNDLPWQFTALSVPTVIFFPAADKASTRVFPSSKPLTVVNLISFVIANLEPDARLKFALRRCSANDGCSGWFDREADPKLREAMDELLRREEEQPKVEKPQENPSRLGDEL